MEAGEEEETRERDLHWINSLCGLPLRKFFLRRRHFLLPSTSFSLAFISLAGNVLMSKSIEENEKEKCFHCISSNHHFLWLIILSFYYAIFLLSHRWVMNEQLEFVLFSPQTNPPSATHEFVCECCLHESKHSPCVLLLFEADKVASYCSITNSEYQPQAPAHTQKQWEQLRWEYNLKNNMKMKELCFDHKETVARAQQVLNCFWCCSTQQALHDDDDHWVWWIS